MIEANSLDMREGEKHLDEIEIGDMVKLPHSEAFWPVTWTEGPVTLDGQYLIGVRGVAQPHLGYGSDMLPCYVFKSEEQ